MRRATTCLLATLAIACETTRVGAPSPPDPAVEPAPASPTAPCGELTRAECLHAVHCTLVAAAGARASDVYVCRDARGNCEVGLRQIGDDRDRCADRIGCRWQEGGCYCPCRGAGRTAVPDGDEADTCQCACSGGPPSGCAPAD